MATTSAPIDLSKRDLTLDLARVFCVLLVVVIHLLMTGVIVDAHGGIGLERTLEQQSWYPHATWIGQIMPLFFVIGGFAGLTAWRSRQRRGGDAPGYISGRLLRLARPAFPLFVFYVVAIGVGLIIVTTTGSSGSGCSTASSSVRDRPSGSSRRTRSARRSSPSWRICTRWRRRAQCSCC